MKNQNKRLMGGLVMMLAGALGGVEIATAQGGADPGLVLEEIVVEARRRTESLQEVPLSVTAVSEEAIKNASIDDLADIQRLLPGITIQEGINENTARIFVRGAGTVTPTIGVEPAVPIYIDDVYTPLGLGATLDLFSIDRVEVLRGPQATLYGRNSFGGAVKVYTKQLSNEVEGSLSFTTGTKDRRDFKGEISAPLIEDRLWLGLGYASLKHDGYQDFIYTGGEGWAENTEIAKFKVQAAPADNVALTFTYDRVTRDAPAKQAKILPGTARPEVLIGFLKGVLEGNGYTGPEVEVPQARAGSNLSRTGVGAQCYYEVAMYCQSPDVDDIETDVTSNAELDTESFAWTAVWDINESLTAKYIGSSRDMENIRAQDVDGTILEFLNVQERFTLDSSSHELQLQWDSDRLQATAGFFYYEEESTGDQLALPIYFYGASGFAPKATLRRNIAGELNGVDVGQFGSLRDGETESKAAYLNLGYEVMEDLRATIGVRWTRDEKSIVTPVQPVIFVGATQHITGDIIPREFGIPENTEVIAARLERGAADADFTKVTPEFTVDWNLTDNLLLFASYKVGFQGGTMFNPNDPFEKNVVVTDEQVVDAYEVGFKSTLLDNRLTFNGAAYYYDYSDLILSVQRAVDRSVSGSGLQGLPNNAASARTVGFELESVLQATESLLLYGNLAFTDFQLGAVYADQVDDDGQFVSVDISDTLYDSVPTLTPDWQVNVGAQYYFNIQPGSLRAYVNAAYRGDMGTNAAPTYETSGIGLVLDNAAAEDYTSDSWVNVGLGATYRSPDEHWRLDAGVRNVFDTRRPVATVFSARGFFGVNQQWNPPRTWYLSVGYDF